MTLMPDEVRNLKDGTKLKLIYSGSAWDEDFGKIYDVIKVGDKLYHTNNQWEDVNEIGTDPYDNLDIIAIIK